MHHTSRRLAAAFVAAAALLVATGATGAPVASANDASARVVSGDAVAQARRGVRAGTLSRDHGTVRPCTARVAGRTVDLGCQYALLAADAGGSTPLATTTPAGYSPAELAAAYGLPATSASGRTVAIVGVGAYPSLEADLATYRQQFGLPACTTANGCLRITDDKGGPALEPGTDPTVSAVEEAYAGETALDVQLASAACPSCKITMVQIPTNIGRLLAAAAFGLPRGLANDFATAVRQARTAGASAVGISYGIPLGFQGRALSTGAPARGLDQAGMAIAVASGDAGYDGTKPLWPQTLPTVTSAGGVTLTKGASGYAATAWGGLFKPSGAIASRFVGAGSSCSPLLPPAVGQPATVAANCDGHRAASDLSAVADPATGVAIYDSYAPSSHAPAGWRVAGGTSAAAPYLAGLYARGGGVAAVHGPNTVYAAPAGTVTDVLGGSNAPTGAAACPAHPALCTGVAGWDGPTGAGIPDGLGAFQ